jgi:hypothetical protein
MAQFPDDHRGHTIFPHTQPLASGLWTAAFSAARLDPNDAAVAVAHQDVPGTFSTRDDAHTAAMLAARAAIDRLLDPSA